MSLLNHYKNILLVGIGNVLRSDDGVGVYITQRINKRPNFDKLVVEVSIENYIGKINNLNPDLLILIDCVDLGKEPGHFDLMPIGKLQNYTWNTHNISLREVSTLFPTSVWILGIHPRNLEIGEEMSEEVKQAADILVTILNEVESPLGFIESYNEIASI